VRRKEKEEAEERGSCETEEKRGSSPRFVLLAIGGDAGDGAFCGLTFDGAHTCIVHCLKYSSPAIGSDVLRSVL
jgi:hypothetical protein